MADAIMGADYRSRVREMDRVVDSVICSYNKSQYVCFVVIGVCYAAV